MNNWLSSSPPTPGDIVPPCRVTCRGFSSLRPECQQDACVANNLCHLIDPTVADSGQSCADWCCVSHSGASVLMVLMFCIALFCLLAGCYYSFLQGKEDEENKKAAMNEALDAASSGPSSLLTNARARLAEFTQTKQQGDAGTVPSAEAS